jgi:hypothetical protein
MFYKQLFHNKVLCASLMCLQFGFVIFWQKDFGTKAAHKTLVKATRVLCCFYLVKNYKIAYNSTTWEAQEQIIQDLEYLEFLKKM